ncbi:glycosyltransferase [Erwinia endophytica]|uniref:glycosyltransferase n=1 Tax=Erwinia endophytica TaxID=1563158 RepID=UPI00186B96ED|nr:glycosyltransferase [Erwinia endophytica]
MTCKLLSVVIPVDHAEKNIVQCVSAFLCQSPVPDEIIIVHRESDIATVDLLREFSGQNNIIIAALPACEPLNICDFGIGLAQGKWLYCCDPAGIVSGGFCADFAQAISRHPDIDVFCFNTRTDEVNPSFITQTRVVHRRQGLMTAQQALSDLLQNDAGYAAGCNFIVPRTALSRWQIMHRGRLYQDATYALEVFLRSSQAWVSDKCHYSLRSPSAVTAITMKDEDNFRARYDAFINGYETLTRLSGSAHSSRELHQLYLIQSFKSMLSLSQANDYQTLEFLFNAIHYFGRDLKAGSFSDWILLRKPEWYSLLFCRRSVTAHV